MRPVSVVVFAFILMSTAAGWAAAGEGAAIFESHKCGMCHKPDKKAAAVSLAEIAKAYADRTEILKLFSGEGKPLIESEKWGMMRGRLPEIQALKEQEKEDLADYILSFK